MKRALLLVGLFSCSNPPSAPAPAPMTSATTATHEAPKTKPDLAPSVPSRDPGREEQLFSALKTSFCFDEAKTDCAPWLMTVQEVKIVGDKALFLTNVDQDAPNMIILASSACRKDARLFSVNTVHLCQDADFTCFYLETRRRLINISLLVRHPEEPMSNLAIIYPMEKKRGPKPAKKTHWGEWVLENWKGDNKTLAEQLGISVSYLEKIIHGRELPGLTLALQIKEFTDGALDLDLLCDPSLAYKKAS